MRLTLKIWRQENASAPGALQTYDLDGVSADIGCWMEACAARRLIDNAGEMNGFLKPETGIFASPLAVRNGLVVLEPGAPALKPADDLCALATAVFSQGG